MLQGKVSPSCPTTCFAVPSKCEAEKKTEMLNDLKTLMGKMEDYLTPTVEPICYTPVCYSSCVPCCPPECVPTAKEDPPDVLVCYKLPGSKAKKTIRKGRSKGKELTESKSRELRAGILYQGCDCERKNGLQDKCLRTQCQGSPSCLTQPPSCGPSQYCQGKHLIKKMNKRESGKDESGEESDSNLTEKTTTYRCFKADVKVPNQQMCFFMPCNPCKL